MTAFADRKDAQAVFIVVFAEQQIHEYAGDIGQRDW